ncbi:protein translocase subunit SecF [Oceanisphaera arctica]|uniref:Protein-export membrane protein SecF n=1 Tax=Oceanisphaera arctica TaxID=641510 RepID=A0A2P5TQ36_9GAMM|nr:protein translocase subunit SecF [Oceanisphaera arctica]PPL17841.1 protein-export membrane protein SecF [Oceanisphaera arctica]GHA23437.1 protein-export membrane protein SecF [Oceanisphaera arctica]
MFEILKTRAPIRFMHYSKAATVVSLALIALCFFSLFTKGLNWGLDFTGGTVVEAAFEQAVELDEVRNNLEQVGLSGATVQNFGTSRDVLIRLAPQEGVDVQQQGESVMAALAEVSASVEMKRLEFVGPAIGAELAEQGGLAILVALLCILLYVGMRFEWRLASGAVLSLAHDVIITLGVFSWMQIEVDLTIVAALLTVVGYSLNDTIVVFDRVRENFRRVRNTSTAEVFDEAITETLSRTLITSATTLVVVVALFLKGGALIHGFATALLLGIGFGTYSSIYIASAWAMLLGVQREHMLPPQIEKEGADQEPLP